MTFRLSLRLRINLEPNGDKVQQLQQQAAAMTTRCNFFRRLKAASRMGRLHAQPGFDGGKGQKGLTLAITLLSLWLTLTNHYPPFPAGHPVSGEKKTKYL
jgi:hypothetical protein